MGIINIKDLKEYLIWREERDNFKPSAPTMSFLVPKSVVEGGSYYRDFKDVYYEFLDEYNAKHPDDKLSNIDVSSYCLKADSAALSKMFNGQRKSIPDEIFRIAILFNLDMKQTNELFKSAGLDMHADHGMSDSKKKRMNIYRYCLENKIYDLIEIDETIDNLKIEGFLTE